MCKHLWRNTESLCTSGDDGDDVGDDEDDDDSEDGDDDGDDDDPFQEDFFKIVQTPMERSQDAKELSESLLRPWTIMMMKEIMVIMDDNDDDQDDM